MQEGEAAVTVEESDAFSHSCWSRAFMSDTTSDASSLDRLCPMVPHEEREDKTRVTTPTSSVRRFSRCVAFALLHRSISTNAASVTWSTRLAHLDMACCTKPGDEEREDAAAMGEEDP